MTTLPERTTFPAQVLIFSEGQPPELCTLGQFFDANEFSSEELEDLFRGFANGWLHKLGGGAAPLTIVKLYEPGDEHLTFAEIACPDFAHHSEHGCRTCSLPALNHYEGGE